jgi:hypothetical protein
MRTASLLALALAFLLCGCGDDHDPTAPGVDPGDPLQRAVWESGAPQDAFQVLLSHEFFSRFTAEDVVERDGLDAVNWQWEPVGEIWRDPGSNSHTDGRWRDPEGRLWRTRTSMRMQRELRLLDAGGGRVSDPADAVGGELRTDLVRRVDVIDDGYDGDPPLRQSVIGSLTLSIDAGVLQHLSGTGSALVEGVYGLPDGIRPLRSTARWTIELDYTGSHSCPALDWQPTIEIWGESIEAPLDVYSGAITAVAGEGSEEGVLRSQDDRFGLGLDRGRSCR